MNAEQILRRFSQMKAARLRHEQIWRQCADYTMPMRGHGIGQNEFDAQTAQTKKAEQLDSTATDSVRILGSGLVSGMVPAASRWVGFDAGDVSDAAQRWMDDAADFIWTNIHASNFDSNAFECAADMAIFGQFAQYEDEDLERGGYRFEHWPVSEVFATTTRMDGVCDTVARAFCLTAEQAVAAFGQDCSERTRALATDKPDEKVEFVWFIYPRLDGKPGASIGKQMPIAACTVEVKEAKLVKESGFQEMPVWVPRWMVIPGSVYGMGPVFDALPDIKTLNELTRMELAAADLAVSGMWGAVEDGVMNPRTVKVGPRRIIAMASKDSMFPLNTAADFKVAWTEKAMLQQAVRKILLADQLQPQDGPAMTATEVHVRVQMIRQLLGPIYGRLQSEWLIPMVMRSFGIAMRRGLLGQIPDELAERTIAIRFISPIARAQRLDEVAAIERLTMQAISMAQAPQLASALDLVDGDEMLRISGHALGVPSKALKDAKAVAAIRDARIRQQQAEQQQAIDAQKQVAMNDALATRVANA